MPRVIHFEISSSDPRRSAAFYEGVFGWKFRKWEGGTEEYWLITTGEEGTPGIDGGMMRATNGFAPVINTVMVDSVDAFVEKAVAGGAEVVHPKNAIPGMGYAAYCKDPDGTVFGLFEADMDAA